MRTKGRPSEGKPNEGKRRQATKGKRKQAGDRTADSIRLKGFPFGRFFWLNNVRGDFSGKVPAFFFRRSTATMRHNPT